MLPVTYFERLSSAHGLKTSAWNRERRVSFRMDFRTPAQVMHVRGGVVGMTTPVRMRELSRSGCSFLSTKKLSIGEIFVLNFNVRGQGSFWFLCVTRRVVEKDRLAFLTGCEITKVLYPGQMICQGSNISTVMWLKVQGEENPEDPLLQADNSAA